MADGWTSRIRVCRAKQRGQVVLTEPATWAEILARVSAKPGKTQQINFYRINDQFRFVDLPGYGYAQVSKQERALFVRLMETYLTHRDCLRRVIHLIDIRHEPTKQDIEAHRWLLTLSVPVCVVATKLDKVSKSAVNPSLATIRKVLRTPYPVIAVSSEKNVGLDVLWDILSADLEVLPSTEDGATDGSMGRPQAEEVTDSPHGLQD